MPAGFSIFNIIHTEPRFSHLHKTGRKVVIHAVVTYNSGSHDSLSVSASTVACISIIFVIPGSQLILKLVTPKEK